MSTELLLEIGTEELPARFVAPALEALAERVLAALDGARIPHGAARTLGTPRRLVVIVDGVAEAGESETKLAVGPAASVAFDASGKPTRAAEGFARKQGVTAEALTRITTDKGEYAAVQVTRAGARTAELLAAELPQRILSIPFPKSMRWGNPEVSFGRPIRWIVALLGAEIVPFRVGPVESGRATRGHRVHGTGSPVPVDSVTAYTAALSQGGVVADPAARRAAIERAVTELAASVGGRAVPDPALLDEVTFLVESVNPVLGSFDTEFLKVPREVLLTAMRTHQRYFAVEDANGQLLPHFVTISNTRVRDPAVVRHGNEAVLRARLADARYFFDLDRKKTLADRLPALEGVTYHKKLGSSRHKVGRIESLAKKLVEAIGAGDPTVVDRAALLCKADLVTEMVGEFPEVQGVIGAYYALADGEPEAVATAIREHYLPRFAGDRLPTSDAGAIVGLADRLDTLAGSFAVGDVPTGAADPFGLRRRALAVIQIMVGRGWSADLSPIIRYAVERVAAAAGVPAKNDIETTLRQFLIGRQATLLQAEGISPDVLEAAVSTGSSLNCVDAARRARALQAWKAYPEAIELYRAVKRIANIVKDQPRRDEGRLELLQEPAERALHDRVSSLAPELRSLAEQGRYDEALERLRTLSPPVTEFFERILVMAENPDLRMARLKLLDSVTELSRSVGDLTKIQIEG